MAAQIQAFALPLSPQPQTLSVTLLGTTYNLRTRWSQLQNCWCIDFADQDNNPIVGSIPLVTGADLLQQYLYLNFGGGLYVYDSQLPPNMVPGFTDLGVTAQILFVPYTT